ncbi:transcriptional regulator [Tamilnaduibacter salinus]|uniref:Transcriptional regulator n=1 Tax=Tamilnaduibacter salinus TaxID=1484056 RepID=A0A2A2I142_9GAMM|nr:helix-turn-helix transcriptional regulator [Tamilnaduibacter salinus]PAV24733.1 transcriptional regulator [Tamilnaduibacter salinus]
MKKCSEQSLTDLGTRVRRARLAKGYSQDDFAERCGLHRTYIGSIERGERNFTVLNLIKIAKALDTSVGDLFGDKTSSDQE